MASEVVEEVTIKLVTKETLDIMITNTRDFERQKLTGITFQIVGLQQQLDSLKNQADYLQGRIDAATDYLGDGGEEALDE